MKKSYHSIIDPAQDAMRTVRMEGEEGEEIAEEVMPEVAATAIGPQLCVHECGQRQQHSDRSSR